MVWNYHYDDLLSARGTRVQLSIAGVPATPKRVLLRYYRIDQEHSNEYTAWKSMGSPQNPSAEQYAQLESSGQLQMITSPQWIALHSGMVATTLNLPRQRIVRHLHIRQRHQFLHFPSPARGHRPIRAVMPTAALIGTESIPGSPPRTLCAEIDR